MKKLSFLAITLVLLVASVSTNSNASHPVKKQPVQKELAIGSETETKLAEVEELQISNEFSEKSNEMLPAAGGNEKLILVLLWLFLGGLAGHRWYAGKPVGANILFILTLGGCGVWAIIDLIKILKDEF